MVSISSIGPEAHMNLWHSSQDLSVDDDTRACGQAEICCVYSPRQLTLSPKADQFLACVSLNIMYFHCDSSSAIYFLLVVRQNPCYHFIFFTASHLETLSIGGMQPEIKVLRK